MHMQMKVHMCRTCFMCNSKCVCVEILHKRKKVHLFGNYAHAKESPYMLKILHMPKKVNMCKTCYMHNRKSILAANSPNVKETTYVQNLCTCHNLTVQGYLMSRGDRSWSTHFFQYNCIGKSVSTNPGLPYITFLKAF